MEALAKLYQKPLDFIDELLDGLTSYRLVLYFLLVLLGWGALISLDKKLPFSWHAILLSVALLVVVCRAFGELFARILNVARNFESDYITALILSLILTPATTPKDFLLLAGAGFAAIASKYVLVIHRQHIFNPAALGAFTAGVLFHHYASWWIATTWLLPPLLIGGLLIVRKMKRFLMVAIFVVVSLIILLLTSHTASNLSIIWEVLSLTPLLFLGFVMLTEPLTSPDAFLKYLPYSLLVALLYSVSWFRLSPEEALLIGNLLAYALVRGKRLQLTLTKADKVASAIYSFTFEYHGLFDFKPGQYLEWTLPLAHSDRRGNRRYLTLSSSPTEHQLSFTVRIPQKPSHFKQALMDFKPGDEVLASHLGGSFTMPGDEDYKLAFIAGGIGITPFRSMIKYLIDKKQERDINLLYAANKADEFVFGELFTQAKHLGLQTEYLETGKRIISADDITTAIPDYQERIFYLSGPYGFVKTTRDLLLDLGLGLNDIRSDYFPGYN
jgi:ferredoxin-NADP reductase